ncbi:hypothetical protein GIB67_015671 [Kingdonia uniflora]|uniref:Uncharacterized protein n=1 Tax=Kingdonia uniflora TaxID=39325 RepID=A0A7J7NU85_9MAGN|nr:hypothetical protein GIB67_015671 [Kingdonia uniflora]
MMLNSMEWQRVKSKYHKFIADHLSRSMSNERRQLLLLLLVVSKCVQLHHRKWTLWRTIHLFLWSSRISLSPGLPLRRYHDNFFYE